MVVIWKLFLLLDEIEMVPCTVFFLTWSGSTCLGPIYGQIELFDNLTSCKQMIDVKLNC